MAAQADNTSTAAQMGSVSDGSQAQASPEAAHLSRDRVAAYSADNVLARIPSGTEDTAQSIEQHRARVQAVLAQLGPRLPAGHVNGRQTST